MKFQSLMSKGVGVAIVAATFSLGFLTAQPAVAAGSLVIRDFVLTNGIYEREPVGNTESFASSDQRGYAFARIMNEGAPTMVTFAWYYGGDLHANVDMNIGTSSGWRTWSSIALRPGNWNVKLKDQNGMVIAERSFMVEHSSGMSTSSPSSSPTMSPGMNKNMDDHTSKSGGSSNYGGWTGQKNPV